MAFELSAAEEWIYQTLSGDSALSALVEGVYRDLRPARPTDAPDCTDTTDTGPDAQPWIVFNLQSGGVDENTAGARVLATPVYQVQLVWREKSVDRDIAKAALNRMDALLTEARAMVDNIATVCKSAGSISYAETTPEGVTYNHRGRLWRLLMGDRSS